MTTLQEAAENLARAEVPALPVRRLDELDEIKDEYRAKTAAIPKPKEPMK